MDYRYSRLFCRSLLIAAGNTKVLVSINGPIEVPRRDELVSETTIDIQFRPISGSPGFSPPPPKTYFRSLRKNPRTQIKTIHFLTDNTFSKPTKSSTNCNTNSLY